jgi:hypothetical protein
MFFFFSRSTDQFSLYSSVFLLHMFQLFEFTYIYFSNHTAACQSDPRSRDHFVQLMAQEREDAFAFDPSRLVDYAEEILLDVPAKQVRTRKSLINIKIFHTALYNTRDPARRAGQTGENFNL